MTKTNFDFFKRNLNSDTVIWETEDGFYTNTVSVLAPEGEYKITKNTANDTYSVEYIPNFGSHEFSVHITMSDAIDYIKGGEF